MNPNCTLLLTRTDVRALLQLDECIDAVEKAFLMHAEGKAIPPGVLEFKSTAGGVHVKGAGLVLGGSYVAVKVSGNFFRNRELYGMENILGLIVLCDATTGFPLAVMDSIEITILRTGAATAVAAKFLARPESHVVTICGCGNQGRVQLRSLACVLPVRQVFAYDTDGGRSLEFSRDLSRELAIEVAPARDLGTSISRSDVLVTCTPSKEFFVNSAWLSPGTFIAAVGADSASKQELDPRLLANSTVVVDILDQCATIGELHHAIEAGVLAREDVHAELGEIVAGRRKGRSSRDEITIFDSTGTGLQDVAAAGVVYEKACRMKRGITAQLLD
jgi:alanine dehydrogenase